jgi:hypothetical protein
MLDLALVTSNPTLPELASVCAYRPWLPPRVWISFSRHSPNWQVVQYFHSPGQSGRIAREVRGSNPSHDTMALLLGWHYEFPQCGIIKGKLKLKNWPGWRAGLYFTRRSWILLAFGKLASDNLHPCCVAAVWCHLMMILPLYCLLHGIIMWQ